MQPHFAMTTAAPKPAKLDDVPYPCPKDHPFAGFIDALHLMIVEKERQEAAGFAPWRNAPAPVPGDPVAALIAALGRLSEERQEAERREAECPVTSPTA